MKVFNLVIRRQDGLDFDVWVVSFMYHSARINDPEKALRDAVQEYLATPDGKAAREYACGDFNWGDAMSSIPAEWFAERGFIVIERETVNLEVEHDEVLDMGNYGDEEAAEDDE